MNEKTAVYRHYDADGALLYVGLSRNPLKRWGQHKALALWFYDISRIEIQWFDSREDASDAEIRAVKSERPIFNTVYNTANPQRKKVETPPPPDTDECPPWLPDGVVVGVTLRDNGPGVDALISAGVPADNIKDGGNPRVLDSLLKMMPPGSVLVLGRGVLLPDGYEVEADKREIHIRAAT